MAYLADGRTSFTAWCRIKRQYGFILRRDPQNCRVFLETDPKIDAAEAARGCRTLAELGDVPERVKTPFVQALEEGRGVGTGDTRRGNPDYSLLKLIGMTPQGIMGKDGGTGSDGLAAPRNARRSKRETAEEFSRRMRGGA
jgi:hypothetical protein